MNSNIIVVGVDSEIGTQWGTTLVTMSDNTKTLKNKDSTLYVLLATYI